MQCSWCSNAMQYRATMQHKYFIFARSRDARETERNNLRAGRETQRSLRSPPLRIRRSAEKNHSSSMVLFVSHACMPCHAMPCRIYIYIYQPDGWFVPATMGNVTYSTAPHITSMAASRVFVTSNSKSIRTYYNCGIVDRACLPACLLDRVPTVLLKSKPTIMVFGF